MLAFVGKRTQVYRILQELNHEARSACVNQKGYRGFVVGHPSYFRNISEEARLFIFQVEQDDYEGKLKYSEGEKKMFQGDFKGYVDTEGKAYG